MNHYFATDGNYGNAENLVIIDTADWTEDEWDIIEQSPEMIAQKLHSNFHKVKTKINFLSLKCKNYS